MKWNPERVCTVIGIAGCFVLLSACTESSGTAGRIASMPLALEGNAPSNSLQAHYDGYGNLRFGISAAQFSAAWNGALRGLPLPAPQDECHTVYPVRMREPAGISFMFEGKRFVRYDVQNAQLVAPGGGRVGMKAATLRTLYGAQLQSSPHKYVQGALYLRIASPNNKGVLVFETDAQGMQGKIVRWHAGIPPQVDYVEGCA